MPVQTVGECKPFLDTVLVEFVDSFNYITASLLIQFSNKGETKIANLFIKMTYAVKKFLHEGLSGRQKTFGD